MTDSGEPPCFNEPIETTVTVHLGLGTNLGDRAVNLQRALERIDRLAPIEAVSSVYETEPIGFSEQPDFWNVVVRCRTELPARQLLAELVAIETGLGRERTFRNAPRIIDIDILLYDDVVTRNGELQLPHPRMHERAFVLRPLLEITPDLRQPRTGLSYAELLARAPEMRAVIIAPPIRIGHETD